MEATTTGNGQTSGHATESFVDAKKALKPIWEHLPQEAAAAHERECDLDVGILACDIDQECVPSHRS